MDALFTTSSFNVSKLLLTACSHVTSAALPTNLATPANSGGQDALVDSIFLRGTGACYYCSMVRCKDTTSGHTIRTYFEEVWFFPEVVFEIGENFVLLQIPRMFVVFQAKPYLCLLRTDTCLFLFSSESYDDIIAGIKEVRRKGLPKIRGTLLSSSISSITKREGELPTLTSIFLAIPTGYWNGMSANLTLVLVGLRVFRDNFAYKEYGMRLMQAPRSAKALHEKVLKLHGIRKLPRSLSFGGTLF
nr:YTH domain-containing protein [Tanacetum cinerariifolium]